MKNIHKQKSIKNSKFLRSLNPFNQSNIYVISQVILLFLSQKEINISLKKNIKTDTCDSLKMVVIFVDLIIGEFCNINEVKSTVGSFCLVRLNPRP